MASEYLFRTLFFIQSAAFIVFVIMYSEILLKPVVKLSAEDHCYCKSTDTRVFDQTASIQAKGRPLLASRGPVSHCTANGIKKRPGVVLLTTANFAYADIALNMLASVKRVGVCVNTTIVAEDQKAYEFLLNYTKGDPAIYVQKTNSGEMDAIEPSRRLRSHYYGIMNKRQAYILTLLEQGREVLFSGSDTFWFRDPFPFFQGAFDMSFRGWDKERIISKSNFCSGFVYLKPTKATILFVRAWVEKMEDNKKKGSFILDQAVMNKLLTADQPVHVDIRVLDADLFPWGPTFFDPVWQKQNHSTVAMHAANIRGHPAKLSIFKEFGMWLVNVTTS